jgi:hypothetical protein
MQVEAKELISDLVTPVQMCPIVPEAPSEAQNTTENEQLTHITTKNNKINCLLGGKCM